MTRKLWLLTATILFSYITFASTLTEFTLASRGYGNFYINNLDNNGCNTYSFQLPDVNGEFFSVLTLHATIQARPKGVAVADFYLNNSGEKIAELDYPGFSDGTVKVDVPVSRLATTNYLKACVIAEGDGSSVTIHPDSKIGIYSGPYFPSRGGVNLELSTYNPVAGVPFTIKAVAKNYGTEDAMVRLMYRKPELRDNLPELNILSGETTSEGTAPECAVRDSSGNCTEPGEYSITYTAVANKAVPMTLLPAVLEYTDVFGDNTTLLSDRPTIGAVEPPQKISLHISFENDRLYTGQEIPLTIRVQNLVKGTVGSIVVTPVTGLEITGSQSETVPSLPEGQTVDLAFTVKGATAGNYLVGCNAEYEGRKLECETTVVTLDEGISEGFIGSLALTAIGLVVLIYFYRKK